MVHRVENVLHADLGAQHLARSPGVTWNSGCWPPCTSTVATPFEPVQPRLDLVGRQFPQMGLRNFVRGEAVAEDRETREVQPMAFDLRRRRQRGLDARQRGVDQLQRQRHVDAPVEVQIDFRRAAAGDRVHILQARNAIDRFLDRAA